MIYDFFTERLRTKAGAEAAIALIMGQTRDFIGTPSSRADHEVLADPYASSTSTGPVESPDTAFDEQSETYYKKAAWEVPERIAKAREDYYSSLATRLESVRALDRGEREMTKEEREGKRVTENELREERKKKELRWRGMEEGWDIVRPETQVTWVDGWQGWLKVFKAPEKTQAEP